MSHSFHDQPFDGWRKIRFSHRPMLCSFAILSLFRVRTGRAVLTKRIQFGFMRTRFTAAFFSRDLFIVKLAADRFSDGIDPMVHVLHRFRSGAHSGSGSLKAVADQPRLVADEPLRRKRPWTGVRFGQESNCRLGMF
jgi:hypothetical protein